MNGPQIRHITDTVVRECCKGDAESLWGREIWPPPPKNPLANCHKNLRTWLSWVCLPTCQILSRSDKGLFLHMRDFVHSCVLVIFFCFFGGVLSITYSQDACNNFNTKYIKWCREKFHLVELNVLIKFHQNNQKVIYFRCFDLYQRPSSEEAGTRSSSGSWRDKDREDKEQTTECVYKVPCASCE